MTDGVNPELLVAATGSLNLFEPGLTPGNVSPSIVVTAPTNTLSASDGTQVTITYCGNDRDGGEGGVVADVLILLDNDNNPLNDLFAGLDMQTAEGAAAIAEICAEDMPFAVDGGVVLGCKKDDGCTVPANGTDFILDVDATRIPRTVDGEPYRIRVSMWDHTNPPVHAYAQGTVSLTSLASGVVDLGKVGRSITGSKFIGFDTGARAGFTGTQLGDFDGDGAGDFVVVARFGRPFERGNIGSAYLVYGLPGQRFGSDVYLNSYGTEYRGCAFAMGHAGPYYRLSFFNGTGSTLEPATDGLMSVATIEDLTGDGRPEIIFGAPYVEQVWEYHDDDPCDSAGFCYGDGLQNPLSTDDPANDDMTSYDYRDGTYTETIQDVEYTFLCSNDGDLLADTPLNQGYIFYVSSENLMENTILDLTLAGQKDPDDINLEEGTLVPGGSVPQGARLRGGDYFTATFDPTTRFGQTLGSMPDLTNGGTVPVQDGRSEFLFSVPSAQGGRGAVLLTWGQNLASFSAQEVQSIPDIRKTDTDPCFRASYVPDGRAIVGAMAGDNFGYANRAGDFNRDGYQDILAGAPGANHGAVDEAGTVYLIFGRLDFGEIDLATMNPPRMEIHGTVTGDRFGENQTVLGDVNNDGFSDVAFGSKLADGPGGVDSGYIGIVFGGRQRTGENTFTVNQVGTSQLPGVVFYGTQVGGNAGAIINDAGDFNHDGFDDLLISAPKETRTVGQTVRRGVAYLIFGGPQLTNGFHLLNEVGAASLPGIVFVSPYAADTADEATIDFVGSAGDVDDDGFSDILVGVSEADFVNPLEPGQRRESAGEAYLIYGNNSGDNVVGR